MSLDPRPRGVLSEADRRYLTNPDEYSKQASYERRRAIIERAHEALHDFPLLVSQLDDESRAEAFEDRDLDQKDHTLNVLPSAFSFLYLGITDTVEPSDLAKDTFEDLVASGVRRAYLERGEPVAEVEVSIDVTKADRTKPLEEMTLTELQQLGQVGEITREEFIDQLADKIQFGRGEASLSPPEKVEKSRGEWLADLFGIEAREE
jgi:hypothetical protein